jgi:hypothetical protein
VFTPRSRCNSTVGRSDTDTLRAPVLKLFCIRNDASTFIVTDLLLCDFALRAMADILCSYVTYETSVNIFLVPLISTCCNCSS